MLTIQARKRSAIPATPGFEGEEKALSAADIQKLINATVNGAISDLKTKDLPKILKDHVDPVSTQLTSIQDAIKALKPAETPPPGDKSQIPPEVNAEILNLKRDAENTRKALEQMKTDKEIAEKKTLTLERHTKIKEALGTVPQGYASDGAAHTAFTIVEPLIKVLDDGTLVGGDNLPVEDFVKDYLPKQHAYLLKPTGAGGAGAGAGGGTGGSSGKVATIESIRPGMSKEERDNAILAIQNASRR